RGGRLRGRLRKEQLHELGDAPASSGRGTYRCRRRPGSRPRLHLEGVTPVGWVLDLDKARDSGVLLTRTSQIDSPKLSQGKPVQYVPQSPSELLDRARKVMPSVTLDEYSGARCVRSEGYGGPPEGWPGAAVLIAECIQNQAA